MKIAIIGRWRATCGVSLHAEIVAQTLLEMGHDVRIFAPTLDTANRDWHHIPLGGDEEIVERCYDEVDEPRQNAKACRRKLVDWDPDTVLVEVYQRLPLSLAEELRDVAARGASIVLVLHTTTYEETRPYLEAFPIDKIAVFDERWLREVLYPYRNELEDKLVVASYPCLDPPARRPNLPFLEKIDRPLLVTFGRQPIEELADYINALDILSQSHSFEYLVVRSDDRSLPYEKPWLKVVHYRLSIEEIYTLLENAVLHLLPKGWSTKPVISSTLYQTIASLTPTIVPDTRYFETIPVDENGFGAVVKYWGVKDLARKLKLLLEDEDVRKQVAEKAREFLKTCSRGKVVKKLVE